MALATEFTPLQGVILFLAIVGLVTELIIMYRDRKKYLLEVPCVLLMLNFILFYGWLLVTSPYDRNASFLWSQFLRLHTVVTVLILASYRIFHVKMNGHSKLNIVADRRDDFANARDVMANNRDEEANAREERQNDREEHNG